VAVPLTVDDLERVRALVEPAADLAVIEAIRLLGGVEPGTLDLEPDQRQLRAALLNDLAVLRYSVHDRAAARGCLVEALACCPDEPLYGANLADVEAALARPQKPRPEAGVDWGFSHLKPWEAATLQLTERVLGGLRGKIVLEVGGSLNLDAAVATGVARWFTCEPQVEDEDPHPNYARRKGDARAMAFAD
jgi:hypothetical protein